MIKWEQLNDYIMKPVYDKDINRWRILEGYKCTNGRFYLFFTDSELHYSRDINNLEIYISDGEENN